MSSDNQDDNDLDPVLRYAPRRVRAQSQPPPQSAALPVDRPSPSLPGNSAESSGDRVIVETRRWRALEPVRVPEPPLDAMPRRDLWTLTLHACAVLGVVALLAWVVAFVPSVRQTVSTAFSGIFASTHFRVSVPPSDVMGVSSSVASSQVTAKAPPAPPNPRVAAAEPAVPRAEERTDAGEPRARTTSEHTVDVQPPAGGQSSPAEQTRPTPVPAERVAPDFVTRQLDPDELASLVRRADDFIKSGDLSSARLLLRRAAEAGSMQAALTLAGTFDPNVLAARSVRDADIAMARLWYERAAQLGSSEAPRRLRQLASKALQ
jgi:cytoskeletal protein RodZ